VTDKSFLEARADDRALIHAVVHRYAHNGRDSLVLDDQLILFTDDAEVLLPGDLRLPAKDIAQVIRGEEAKYIRHHITTIDIKWEGADTARVESQFFAITNEASPDHWGCWRDIFAKQSDGSWLLKERAIVVDGAADNGWFRRMYPDAP
jgi:hypothetical protein